MDDLQLQRLGQLLRARTGWNLGAPETQRLREKVSTRLQDRRLSLAAYCTLLEEGADADEWRELIGLLVIPETFFFRDSGQMTLLRNRILPELISRRAAVRSLRIWSAGCSTGEEPYSIAMLLHDLLPERAAWQLQIVGTDVDPAALQKARRGRYGQWSLRNAASNVSAFFTRVGEEWQLDERISKMVTFRPGNLVHDPFPSLHAELHEMDLILCRNVFIYFERPIVAAVVRKMAATLRDGGYLLTGHAELHDIKPPGLQPRKFPESMAHQRVAVVPEPPAAPAAVARPRAVVPAPRPRPMASAPVEPPRRIPVREPAPDTQQASIEQVERLLESGACSAALKWAEELLRLQPASFPTLCLAARATAHLGDHNRAAEYCRSAMDAAPFAPEPYYLLAQVAEEQGDTQGARELLRKCLYLAPQFVPAYLELGDIHEREGDFPRARKMRTSALDLLRAAPPESRLPSYGATTTGQLAAQLESVLARSK